MNNQRRRIGMMEAELHPEDPSCPRCNAAPGQRGILILRTGVLEVLERDESGRLLPIYCPGCLQVPFAVLPENQR
jgi:BRCT domain type II-containing protein